MGPTTLTTIGGNTSGSVDGKAFFNGNGVYQKTVQRSSRIHGYGRPLYSSAAMPVAGGGGGGDGGAAGGLTPAKPLTSVRSVKQQQLAVNSLGYAPPLDVDGDWGPKTAAGVKWLQQKVGAGVDGEWGLETERHYTAFAK
ncbi:MAG TPA: peptidoglycan-binding domain-containing protein [Gaiellaceae bacterium]|nr:peptidoglycan-binding domain-containing protein [Gaiellaceae bacterium]